MWFLANDSVSKSEATAIKKSTFETYKAETATLEEQYQYYNSIDIHIKYALAQFIQSEHLNEYINCFERVAETDYRFVNPKGVDKLKKEWPDIWNEFGF